MGITGGGARLARDQGAGRRRVTVALSALALEALGGGDPSLRMENALLCYLGDSESGRPAWSYPGFLRGSETRGDVEIEIEIEAPLWRSFEEEAARQGVSVEQLAEHAAFYYEAELDAGRVTRRILEDLGTGEGESAED